ncbi:transposase [Candidatus Poribacteria bacterium]|nr:transposase [Candidatus Poribacteria bacterium]
MKKLYAAVKGSDAYCGLPHKVSNWVLKTLKKNWTAYFKAHREWEKNPEKFTDNPRIPKYKDKETGRNVLTYELGAISRKKEILEQGIIKPSGLSFEVKTNQAEYDIVRIVPRKTHYVVEVVYTQPETKAQVNPDWIAGVDIGLNNLAAIASNKPGFVPLLVNGRPLKSQNQYYNKEKASLQSQLDDPEYGTSQRIESLTDRRNRRINHDLHTASRRLVDWLVKEQIGTLAIGKNDGWKQEINIGKRNNQNFVSIPHSRFISMLTYKAQLVGIKVVVTEESYTSKCSFLDLESIEKHETYMGQRVRRGLFRASNGRFINADVNGAYNLIRKVAPNAFADGVEGIAVCPKWLLAA